MGKPRIILRPTSMLRKQAGQMRKLLGLWDDSKIKPKVDPSPAPVVKDGKPEFLVRREGLNSTHITRRQIVLNRHFTEIISDVLANNLKRQLIDIGVSVTSIETKAWNKGVNVFYSTDKPFDMSLHKELNSLVISLRSAIAERRLIGRTPLVNFVYDETAELERNLERVLNVTRKDDCEEESSLVKVSTSNKMQTATKGRSEKDSSLNTKRFSAPDDMTNMMLGLNYPSLYDNVAMKLEHGRGQSARLISNVSLAPTTPLVIGPVDNMDDCDPTKRIVQMQKFIVNQKKKNEYKFRLRRKEELLARDNIKWDWPDAEENTDN